MIRQSVVRKTKREKKNSSVCRCGIGNGKEVIGRPVPTNRPSICENERRMSTDNETDLLQLLTKRKQERSPELSRKGVMERSIGQQYLLVGAELSLTQPYEVRPVWAGRSKGDCSIRDVPYLWQLMPGPSQLCTNNYRIVVNKKKTNELRRKKLRCASFSPSCMQASQFDSHPNGKYAVNLVGASNLHVILCVFLFCFQENYFFFILMRTLIFILLPLVCKATRLDVPMWPVHAEPHPQRDCEIIETNYGGLHLQGEINTPCNGTHRMSGSDWRDRRVEGVAKIRVNLWNCAVFKESCVLLTQLVEYVSMALDWERVILLTKSCLQTNRTSWYFLWYIYWKYWLPTNSIE